MSTSSIQRTVASGSTAVFSVPFPYLDKTHVQIRVAGVLKTFGVDYTFPTSSTIQLSAGNPTAGTIVERRRVTPTDPLTVFQPGNLDSGDLNVAELQPLYVAQEASDDEQDRNAAQWSTPSTTPGLPGVGGTIAHGVDGNFLAYDADGNVVDSGRSPATLESSEAAAAASASAAASSAAGSAISATAAAGSATAASASATLAQEWAANPEDVAVPGGGGLFSALHYAAKAAAALAAMALPASPVASSFLQRNAGNTAYVAVTPDAARLAMVALKGQDIASYAGADENAKIAAMYAANPTQPYMYRADSHFGLIKDTAPLNYQGTRASYVLQHRDAAAIGTNTIVPGVMFQFTYTGDGNVTPASDTSTSVAMGLTASTIKSGDSSGHCMTAIGELRTVGAVGYNELGLFQGTGTNVSSTHGTISGVEMLIRDSPDAGTTHFDTAMHSVIGRMARYHNGTKDAACFLASSEGTIGPAAILSANPGGLHTWARGIDFKDALFSTGQAVLLPNNTSFAWMTSSAAAAPAMFLSGANELWLTGATTTSAIVFANSALAKSLQVPGVASAVNFVEISGNITGNAPTIWVKGTDTDIGVTWGTKGAGVHSYYTGGSSFYKQFEIGAVTSAVNFVSVKGAVTTGHPIIQPGGSDANPSIIVQGKGTGGVFIKDGGAASKFQVNTTGIGFFGVTPAAQGAIAVPTGTIQRTTYATSTVTLAQLAGVVMAIITDMRAYGLSA